MATNNITAGFAGADDLNAVAGFKNAYMVNWTEEFADEVTKTADEIDGLIISGLPVSLSAFKYSLDNNANTFNEAIEGDKNTGTAPSNTTLNLVFTKIDPIKLFQVRNMVYRRVIVFLEGHSGDVLCVGLTNGVRFQNTTDVAGEMGGNNQFILAGTAGEPEPSHFLSDTAITSLKGAVA